MEAAPHLSPELLQQIIGNQSKELEIRAQELALKKQEDDHSFEFSQKAVEAQLEDRKSQRDYDNGSQKQRYLLIAFIAAIVFVIIITTLCLNKDAIAFEIIKAAVLILAGGLGGYGITKGKISRNEGTNREKE